LSSRALPSGEKEAGCDVRNMGCGERAFFGFLVVPEHREKGMTVSRKGGKKPDCLKSRGGHHQKKKTELHMGVEGGKVGAADASSNEKKKEMGKNATVLENKNVCRQEKSGSQWSGGGGGCLCF